MDSYKDKLLPDGGYSCAYYKSMAGLWNHGSNEEVRFIVREKVDADRLRRARVQLRTITEEMSRLRSDASGLRLLLGE
jgi:hypothetical protein